MATIDIGKIKPVFKGTYDNSTAYVLDDIVYYNGSSYVAKTSTTGNLPTDNTKWNVLASGSGGIWDSTLSLGSAGQALKVNSAGNALEFGSAGGIRQVVQGTSSTVFTQNSPNASTWYFPSSNKLTATITPSSTSSKILVNYMSTVRIDSPSSDMGGALALKEIISGGSTTTYHPTDHGGGVKVYSSGFYFATTISSNVRVRLNEFTLLSPNTTSAITYEVGVGGYSVSDVRLNDDNSQGRILLMEVTV